jgi:hypothetical protein
MRTQMALSPLWIGASLMAAVLSVTSTMRLSAHQTDVISVDGVNRLRRA